MRANIWRLEDVHRRLRYICRTGERQYDDQAVIVSANVSPDVARASNEMRAVAALRPNSKRRFVHFVLSLKRGKLTRAQWEFAVNIALERLGLNPRLHLFLAATHLGGMHEHCHVLVNRVGLDGRLWTGKYDMRLLTQATWEIAHVLGLEYRSEVDAFGDHRSLVKINRVLVRRGLTPLSGVRIARSLQDCLSDSTDLESFFARSGEAGLRLEKTFHASGNLKGLVLSVDGTAYRIGLKKISQGRISLGSVQAFLQDQQGDIESVASERYDEQAAEGAWEGAIDDEDDSFIEEVPHPSPLTDSDSRDSDDLDDDDGRLDRDAVDDCQLGESPPEM